MSGITENNVVDIGNECTKRLQYYIKKKDNVMNNKEISKDRKKM